MNAVAPGLFAIDLDGTFLDDDRQLVDANLRALERLGECGMLRVVATGRSLYSALRVMPDSLPVDYLVFSSGIGVASWPARDILCAHELEADRVAQVADCLRRHGCDFMLQGPVPDTHCFAFHRASPAGSNSDFEHRLQLYRAHATALQDTLLPRASQFVVVHPQVGGVALWQHLRATLQGVHVVRTTSPLDRRSVWIEIFPAQVSKAAGCAWLAARHGVRDGCTAAVGNDFNDVDLLDWATAAYVVDNAPAELKARHRPVAGNGEGGVAQAADHWLVTCAASTPAASDGDGAG